jgi:hypothetical protein
MRSTIVTLEPASNTMLLEQCSLFAKGAPCRALDATKSEQGACWHQQLRQKIEN